MLPVWRELRLNKEIWDLFTRKEEYFSKQLDEHDRFSFAFSNYKDNILEPQVSKFLVENGFRLEYPENKKFAVCLTHDVDDIYPPITHMLLSALYSMTTLNFNQLSKQVLWKFSKRWRSPYYNFEQIMEIEKRFDAKSTFYFLTAEQDIRRFRYNIEDLAGELKFIVDSGWDVGLHVGYYSFDNLQSITKEKKRLEKVVGKEVIGCRNHYLRFKVPDTWEVLAKAGFKYDTSFGYPNSIGFRNGMCHPFRPFNLNSKSEIDIVEIPLTMMDTTLFGYMKLDLVNALTMAKRMIDLVEGYNGVLTILWHNDVFSCPFREKWAKLYQSILSYCYEKDAWLTSADGVYRWYSKDEPSLTTQRSRR